MKTTDGRARYGQETGVGMSHSTCNAKNFRGDSFSSPLIITAKYAQGEPSGWLKPPVDLVLTVSAAGRSLLQLPNAQAGRWNIPHQSQREVLTILLDHPVTLFDLISHHNL